MQSCWSHDPLKRPPFRKLVERTELLLSENTKNVSELSILPQIQICCMRKKEAVGIESDWRTVSQATLKLFTDGCSVP